MAASLFLIHERELSRAYSLVSQQVLQVLSSASSVASLLFGLVSYLVIQGELTIGQLIAFRIISGYVVGPLINLATSWQTFQGVAFD